MTCGDPPVEPSPWLDPDLRSAAVRMLRRARDGWPVTDDVCEAVDDLRAAVERADAAAFRRAIRDLESSGPVRATPMNTGSRVPPPDRHRDEVTVRERIEEIIGRLDDVGDPAR